MFEHPNATLVNHLYDAFDEKDGERLKKLIAEDAVWYVPGSTPISGEHRGHAAIFAYFERLAELSGGTFRAELVDILASDMHAVALASATAKRGDRTFEGSYLLLMRIENGRIVEARLFNDDPAAFEALWAYGLCALWSSGPAPVQGAMSPARIETLADGVFAIAMTLLAFNLTVPEVLPTRDPAEVLPGELLGLLPRFIIYAISFVVLGIYRVAHHAQFRVIHNADRPLPWINILFLMLVAFVPFSTSLRSRYWTAPVAVQVYGLLLILIGGAAYLHWGYATSGRRLVPPSTQDSLIRAAKRRIAIAPAVCAIAIAFSFVSTAVSIALYALLIPFYIALAGLDRHVFRRSP